MEIVMDTHYSSRDQSQTFEPLQPLYGQPLFYSETLQALE